MSAAWRTPSDAELARYLRGDSDPSESRAIDQWLEASAEHRQRLDDLRLVLRATEPPRPEWDRERSWARLAERLEPARRPEVVRGRPAAGAGYWQRGLIAAGIAAVLAAGWVAQRTWQRSPAPAPVAVAMTERRTGAGERSTFRLADGTAVMLGPASSIRYSAADYGRRSRVVELEGDGYFEVVHDETRPFAVRTPTVLVRDLGTRFVVRARPGQRPVEVGVMEGRVAIAHPATPTDSVALGAGDAARIDGGQPPVVQRGVNLERYAAWTEGRLVFQRTPLAEVVEDLERWYDIDIELVGHGVERRVLTAGFRDKPAAAVLALVAASLDLTLSGSGKRFVLGTR